MSFLLCLLMTIPASLFAQIDPVGEIVLNQNDGVPHGAAGNSKFLFIA